MEWVVIVILAVLLIAAISRIGQLSNQLPVVEMPSYEADPIDIIKSDWFNMNYKLVSVEEEDGTKQCEIRDKRTHATLAYVGEDLVIHSIKQVEKK